MLTALPNQCIINQVIDNFIKTGRHQLIDLWVGQSFYVSFVSLLIVRAKISNIWQRKNAFNQFDIYTSYACKHCR